MNKRQLLLAGIGAGIGLANLNQGAQAQNAPDALGRVGEEKPKVIPRRNATTKKLFLTPPSWPNAITTDPSGAFWVQEQRHDEGPERAWLIDINGKVLREVVTRCVNCSGMAFGDGFLWSGANGVGTPPVMGIFQTDLGGKTISHRQIPFRGPLPNGGSVHGMAWERGKLWIQANRLESLLRIDPKTWEVDYMFPAARVPRIHGIEYDNGYIWQAYGVQNPDVRGYEGYTPGLVKYEVATGQVVEFVDFVPGSCDVHDIAVLDGKLYGVDSGEHPGWAIDVPSYQQPGFPPLNSPSGGWVFRIDII